MHIKYGVNLLLYVKAYSSMFLAAKSRRRFSCSVLFFVNYGSSLVLFFVNLTYLLVWIFIEPCN